MADLKISALPASTTPLAGTEVLPIVQSSATRQVSVANLTAGRTQTSNGIVQGTAATGYNFTANTPAAGMTSQLLNNYEEGTWTVTWTSVTGTPSNLTGYYTRVGRLVTFSYAAGITSLTGVGGTTRFSLPISPAQFSAGSIASQLGNVSGSLEIDAGDLKAYPTSFTSGYMVFAGSYIA